VLSGTRFVRGLSAIVNSVYLETFRFQVLFDELAELGIVVYY
jgi:hypothetical protein